MINFFKKAVIVILTAAFLFLSKEAFAMKTLQQSKIFKNEISLKYLLYLPKDYGKTGEKWPLIVFLHGAGERGNDLNKVKVHGIPKMLDTRDDFQFVVVSPQCPANAWWTDYLQSINALIEQIAKEYNIDESRIYMTGLSMGGFGTWNMAERYPDLFAAIAPICGGGETFLANYIKAPVWAFHGAKDDIVPLQRSQEMVDAVKKNGVEVQFTVYPDLMHNCWDAAYANEELYKWFLSHKKNSKNE
ncbi:MAG: prolyl oligopeptidase family serine peptidase [Phycisphaerales bacterium]